MNSLSMNRLLTRPPATLSPIGGEGRGEGVVHRPNACAKERRLSMNRPLTPSLSPSDGERVAEGRVRGGSWSRCVRKSERRVSMNRPFVLLVVLDSSSWFRGRERLGSWSQCAILESSSPPINRLSERGQPCPREPSPRNSRTRLSALLSVVGSWSRGAILEYDSWNRLRQPAALFE